MKPTISDPQYELYMGDCRDVLSAMPEQSIDAILTSPPYWGLRSYKADSLVWDNSSGCEHEWGNIQEARRKRSENDVVDMKSKEATKLASAFNSTGGNFCLKCNAWRGQLGSEPDPDLFIKHLCDIFDLTKRVLKKTGSLWVNLDDSFNANYRGSAIPNDFSIKHRSKADIDFMGKSRNNRTDIPAKSLCAIPERFVLEMLKRGWIYRQCIIWQKPSCMPESVKDRFTRDFEYLYHFTQQQKYFFERQFEPYTQPLDRWGGDTLKANGNSSWDDGTGQTIYRDRNMRPNSLGRNRRSVWSINPSPQKAVKKGAVAHYAAFPTALCNIPILSTVPEQICTRCGKPRTKVYETNTTHTERQPEYETGLAPIRHSLPSSERNDISKSGYGSSEVKEVGLSDCGCGAPFVSGIIMDIFAGTGSVAVEARKLGRKAVLIEVSESYANIIRSRLEKIPLPLVR